MLDHAGIEVVACDIFGTTVDRYSGVCLQVTSILESVDAGVEASTFVRRWRDVNRPAMLRVLSGERAWVNLDTLNRESLDELLDGDSLGTELDDEARDRLVRAWHVLPAWPDAVEGIARLRRRYTVAAFSNGGLALLTRLVKAADLRFDCLLSAEFARTYKPGPRAYTTAAAFLDTDPDRILLVAAHGWDLEGARQAGFRTAFIERPDVSPGRRADRPDPDADVTVASYVELADALGC